MMTVGRPPDTTRSAQRVPLWDNARFISVALVVVGHGIQRQTYDSNNALIVYLFVYAWHMPAFAVISGYFSKSAPPGVKQMKKVITDILVPYVLMESIWTLVQFLVEGNRNVNPTTPNWTLWFLLALGIFRLVLPYLALLRWPLLWAVLLSVTIGYFDNVDSTFSMARAIGILPFFVLGWRAREWGVVDRWRVAEVQAWWLRAIAILVFAAWLFVVVAFIGNWREIDLRYWFFYDRGYETLGTLGWWSGLIRLGVIALGALLCAAFLILVPRRETWLTELGQATMYVYLLHSFVLYPVRESGFLRDEHSSAGWLIAVIVACLLVAVLLASKPVRRLFRPIIEPRPGWLFSDRRSGPHRPSQVDPTGSGRR